MAPGARSPRDAIVAAVVTVLAVGTISAGAVLETRYARAGKAHLAYQVVGHGDQDVLLIQAIPSHVELVWDNPGFARMVGSLARFSRVAFYDRRGVGLSDPVPRPPLLEERAADVAAVLDAIGSERATIVAIGEGGLAAAMFAAAEPERVNALVLIGCYARITRAADYPHGWDPEEYSALITRLAGSWGNGDFMGLIYPMLETDAVLRGWAARFERYGASPGVALSSLRALAELDVRDVLPAVGVPTLVVHRTGDPVHTVSHARYLVEHIPDARLLELPGDFVGTYFDMSPEETIEIGEFLTGTRNVAPDRVLATVLFTDIVGSTELATRIGDRAWRDLLDRHDGMLRHLVRLHGGRMIRSTGDGALSVFDGPARGVACAMAIRDASVELGISVRAGLHTGEVELRGDDVGGIAVHIAARVSAEAGADEILVSRTVVDLVVGSGIEFDGRGERSLKGLEDQWQLFAVGPASASGLSFSGSRPGGQGAPLR